MATKLREPPPTYEAIRAYIKKDSGPYVSTCDIAAVKRKMKYEMREAPNRIGKNPKKPYPSEKIEAAIIEALNKA